MVAGNRLWGVLLGVRSVLVPRIYTAIILSSADNGRVNGHCYRMHCRCLAFWLGAAANRARGPRWLAAHTHGRNPCCAPMAHDIFGWGLRPTARAATGGWPHRRMAATICAGRQLPSGGGAPRLWLWAPFSRRRRRHASRVPSFRLARCDLFGSFVVSVCRGLMEAGRPSSSIEKTGAASATDFFDVWFLARRCWYAAAMCWEVGGWLGGGGVAASGHPPPAARRLVVVVLIYVKNLAMSKKSRIFAL